MLFKEDCSMKSMVTPEERLMSEADFGLFYAKVLIGKNKAIDFQNQGFDVLDTKNVNYYPRIHKVSWKKASVECEDVQVLDEKSDEYTLPQKLWIISKKNQPKSMKA